MLPIHVPYDLIVGGACRDCLNDIEQVNDYDVCYINKSKYIQALEELINHGFSCKKTTSYKESGINVVLSRWKKRGTKYKHYDIFLLDTNMNGAIKMVKSFPLTSSACYQKHGETIVVEEKHLKDINNSTLEVNNPDVTLSELYGQVGKLSKRGWKVGGTIVSHFLNKMDAIIANPECFCKMEYRYVREKSGSYFTSYKVSRKMIKEFVKLLDDDNRVLAFMSSNNKVLKAVQKEYNRTLWWNKVLVKLKLRKGYECD